jgi:hypothetical protein
MRRPIVTPLAVCLATLGAAGAGANAAPRDRASGVNTFFACEPAFVFEVAGAAARCRRPGTVLSAVMVACPQTDGVALGERVDAVGEKDMCAASNPGAVISVERRCPSDYTRRVVPGPDRCERPSPELIQAPAMPVLR